MVAPAMIGPEGRLKSVTTGFPATTAATAAVTEAVVVLVAVSVPRQVMTALPDAGAVQVTTVEAGLPLVKTGVPSVPAVADTSSETSVARYMPLGWLAVQVTVTALPGAMPEQVPGTVAQSPAPTESAAVQIALAAARGEQEERRNECADEGPGRHGRGPSARVAPRRPL